MDARAGDLPTAVKAEIRVDTSDPAELRSGMDEIDHLRSQYRKMMRDLTVNLHKVRSRVVELDRLREAVEDRLRSVERQAELGQQQQQHDLVDFKTLAYKSLGPEAQAPTFMEIADAERPGPARSDWRGYVRRLFAKVRDGRAV